MNMMFPVGETKKIRLCKTVILHKNLQSTEFTNKTDKKPTLYCLTANHVLKVAIEQTQIPVCTF